MGSGRAGGAENITSSIMMRLIMMMVMMRLMMRMVMKMTEAFYAVEDEDDEAFSKFPIDRPDISG